MIVNAIIAMLSTGMLFILFFLYKFLKTFFEFIKTSLSYKTYYAIIKDLKDSRISYENSRMVGRVFYYNAEIEELQKIALYTEKTKGNTNSKLKKGDRLKVYYNEQYNYTIDYKEKTSNVIYNLFGFLFFTCVLVVILVIYFVFF